jgi:hypothetical protein
MRLTYAETNESNKVTSDFPRISKTIIIIREKYKISPCGLFDLQFTPCGIKTNSKVPVVCKKNNLVPTVKLHPLT